MHWKRIITFLVPISFLLYLSLPCPKWQASLLSASTDADTDELKDILEATPRQSDKFQPANVAIIVLGYEIRDKEFITLPLLSRLGLAYSIAQQRYYRKLTVPGAKDETTLAVFTGGVTPDRNKGKSEGTIMKEWFEKAMSYVNRISDIENLSLKPLNNTSDSLYDLTSSDDATSILKSLLYDFPLNNIPLLTENRSTSTYENALFSLPILQKYESEHKISISHLLVVTNRFHQIRSQALFSKLLASSDSDYNLLIPSYNNSFSEMGVTQLDFWREIAAIALYSYRKWI